jgi:predicted Zn-dependent protease
MDDRLGPPRTGEWRALFRERPQSFEDYVASCANRRTSTRFAFHLQPLGRAGARTDLLERMRGRAEEFFGLPARVGDPLPMIEDGWAPQQRRHNASILIDRLAPRAPADALVCLAVIEEDLFARGLPWVFGEGNFENRCGVVSFARLGSAGRALKLMCHEACHVLSIAHCTTRRCLMQGANSLQEFDATPPDLCRVDLQKLRWNTGTAAENHVLAPATGA